MPIIRVQPSSFNPHLLSSSIKKANSAKKFKAIATENAFEIKQITDPAQKQGIKISKIKADDTGGTHCDYVYSFMISGMMC